MKANRNNGKNWKKLDLKEVNFVKTLSVSMPG